MTELAPTRPALRGDAFSRVAAGVRTEVGFARLAMAAVALHVADDSFLQPNPGTSAADHLAGGLVPIAALAAAAWGYGRVRAGARATIALLAGFLGVLVGTEAVYYTTATGPSGDDFTGLLSVAAGLASPASARGRSGARARPPTACGGAGAAAACSPPARTSS
jgi:hypothetical protein